MSMLKNIGARQSSFAGQPYTRTFFKHQRRKIFDAFVRTEAKKPYRNALIEPSVGKPSASQAYTFDPINPNLRDFAIFLASNRFRLDYALAALEHRSTLVADAETLTWRGTVKLLLHRKDAISDIEQALSLVPADRFVRIMRRTYWLIRAEKLDQCEDELRRILNQKPDDGHALMLLAIFRCRKEPAQALDIFKKIAQREPNNDFPLAALAICDCNQNRVLSAKKFAEKALTINPSNASAIGVLKRIRPDIHVRYTKNPWDAGRACGWTLDDFLEEPLWAIRKEPVKTP